jgi:hypothetical protein
LANTVSLIQFGKNSNFLNGTTNLFSALVRLRKQDVPRTFWVDAICINQGDDAEKTHQLALMGRIYKEAARAVVWLGPGFWNMGHGLYQLKRMLTLEGNTEPQNPRQPLEDIIDKGLQEVLA